MAVGDIYIKLKKSSRKELCCLAKDLFDYIDEIHINKLEDESNIPRGYNLLQRIPPKPEVPEGMYKGYHFKIEDGVIKRFYLVCSGYNDLQLLVEEDYKEAVQSFMDESVQSKGYSSILEVISYLNDLDPEYAADAQAAFNWRSSVRRTSQDLISDMFDGKIEKLSLSDFISRLPVLEW